MRPLLRPKLTIAIGRTNRHGLAEIRLARRLNSGNMDRSSAGDLKTCSSYSGECNKCRYVKPCWRRRSPRRRLDRYLGDIAGIGADPALRHQGDLKSLDPYTLRETTTTRITRMSMRVSSAETGSEDHSSARGKLGDAGADTLALSSPP